jgi:hypothetical protein
MCLFSDVSIQTIQHRIVRCLMNWNWLGRRRSWRGISLDVLKKTANTNKKYVKMAGCNDAENDLRGSGSGLVNVLNRHVCGE